MTGQAMPRALRVIRTRDFNAVYEARLRTSVGPLVVWAAPNEVGHCRLGLAISRRTGSAPLRNRIRRLIREAFRLQQHELPTEPRGYDLVVSVRRHATPDLSCYRDALGKAVRTLHRTWSKRADSTNT